MLRKNEDDSSLVQSRNTYVSPAATSDSGTDSSSIQTNIGPCRSVTLSTSRVTNLDPAAFFDQTTMTARDAFSAAWILTVSELPGLSESDHQTVQPKRFRAFPNARVYCRSPFEKLMKMSIVNIAPWVSREPTTIARSCAPTNKNLSTKIVSSLVVAFSWAPPYATVLSRLKGPFHWVSSAKSRCGSISTALARSRRTPHGDRCAICRWHTIAATMAGSRCRTAACTLVCIFGMSSDLSGLPCGRVPKSPRRTCS